jgi:hypothetical protein
MQIGIPNYEIYTEPQNISVVTDYTIALPQTADFFTFDSTEDLNDTITGYADNFIAS